MARVQFAATAVLLCVTTVWGSTFFLLKDLMRQMPPLDFLGTRFALAGLLVVLFQFHRVRTASGQEWRRSFVLGAVYSAGQLLQTVGLQYTDASISGFITGMYVVFTPLILAVALRTKLGPRVWSAVGLATAGLGMLGLQVGEQGVAVGHGELLTLAGAFCYAVHIVLQGRWTKESDPLTLGSLQLIAAGIILGAAALPGGVTLPHTGGAWASFLYMTVVAGIGAVVAQAWAQSRLTTTTAAIVIATEPVFAAAFAVLFGGEAVTWRMLAGGTLILAAMFLIEAPSRNAKPAVVPLSPRHSTEASPGSSGQPRRGSG